MHNYSSGWNNGVTCSDFSFKLIVAIWPRGQKPVACVQQESRSVNNEAKHTRSIESSDVFRRIGEKEIKEYSDKYLIFYESRSEFD